MTPRARLEIAGAVALPLAGFLACLAMHGCQPKPGPAPPTPPGWTAPSGEAPKIPDAPGKPVAVVTGSGGFRRKLSPAGKPLSTSPAPAGEPAALPRRTDTPGPSPLAGPNAAHPTGCGGFDVTPDDLAVKCRAELVMLDGHPFARMFGDAGVQTPAGEVWRGEARLEDVRLDWTPPPAPPRVARTLLGVSAGLTSGPGWTVGGVLLPRAWAFDSRIAEGRVGAWASYEQDALEARAAAGVTVLFGIGKR